MTRIEENIVKSRMLGESMDRAASRVLSGLDKAARSHGTGGRGAVSVRYVTVSGKVRTVR